MNAGLVNCREFDDLILLYGSVTTSSEDLNPSAVATSSKLVSPNAIEDFLSRESNN